MPQTATASFVLTRSVLAPVAICVSVSLAMVSIALASDTDADTIAPRTEPVLIENAVELEHQAWQSDEFVREGGEVVWVKSIWGRNNEHSYNFWENRAAWGDANPWYLLFPTIAWLDGKLYASFCEASLPHGYGSSILHVIVGDEKLEKWTSVAHYERQGGLNSTSLSRTTDGRLMITGIGWSDNMMGAFSRDGVTWTPLQPFKVVGQDQNTIGQLFKIAWRDGKAYGFSRPGAPWVSEDGINYKKITVEEPVDGKLGGNETASTFLGDQWIVFQRSGYVVTSFPPYTKWELNTSNSRGEHKNGGPDIITLPDGQVVAGSRASGYPKLGDLRGGHTATLFRYENGELKPMLAFQSGGTMTGYPSFSWHDGYLYVSFLRDRPGSNAWESCRAEFVLAKVKWPLRSVADASPE